MNSKNKNKNRIENKIYIVDIMNALIAEVFLAFAIANFSKHHILASSMTITAWSGILVTEIVYIALSYSKNERNGFSAIMNIANGTMLIVAGLIYWINWENIILGLFVIFLTIITIVKKNNIKITDIDKEEK